MPQLEQWAIYDFGYGQVLAGQVYNHPKFPPGKIVTTNILVGVSDKEEIITESGTHYELGNVNPHYEEMYPNARERLIADLKVRNDRNENKNS